MKNNHEEKIAIMQEYLSKMEDGGSTYHIGGNIPSKKIDNAVKTFATGVDRKTIIGLYDTTITGNGKTGFIFTEDGVYWYGGIFTEREHLFYNDIKSISIINTQKKDNDRKLEITLFSGEIKVIDCGLINKTPLKKFLETIISETQDTKEEDEEKIITKTQNIENDDDGIKLARTLFGLLYIPDSEMKRASDSIRASCGQIVDKLTDIRENIMNSPDEEYEDNDLTQDKNK